MPWKKTDAMSERVKFIVEWEKRWIAAEGGRVDVAELCRMHGVSRQTGYVWINRFMEAGFEVRAMEDLSRKPHSNPRAVTLEMQDFIVQARKTYPKWGPVKLRKWLVERFPKHSFPSASCIALVLQRRGMVVPRKRRKPVQGVVVSPPFPECTAPNDVWCMDFKGWYRLGTDEKCYPFTLLDAFSRMLLRCEGLLEPNGEAVRRILDAAFREFGLPKTIRSDGGPPFFSSQSPASLSAVGIWLLRLGLTLECIAPGKPEQNGRLERFHRTLKASVPPAPTLAEQQRAFDAFRAEYDFERPHAALGLSTPFSCFRRSSRRYPRRLLSSRDHSSLGHVEQVDRRGWISWRPRRRIFIGEAFSLEYVRLWPLDGAGWEVYFGEICLGVIDSSNYELIPRRRGKGPMRLSFLAGASSDRPVPDREARVANGDGDGHSPLPVDSPQTACPQERPAASAGRRRSASAS
jgi:putative transposase